MTTNPLFFQHANPRDLATQADELRAVMDAAYLRGVEIMFLELAELFDARQDIVKISFDQDGDVNNMPMFTCLDRDNEDLSEDIEEVEALAETWNDRQSPATEGFLTALEGVVFHRASFEQDVLAACKKLQREDLLRKGPDIDEWRSSFASHLAAIALDRASPQVARASFKSRM